MTVFAGPGCDPALDVQEIPVRWPRISQAARADVSMTADAWLEEHHAYLTLMLELSRTGSSTWCTTTASITCRSRWLRPCPTPMVTTLHTPPTPWLESAIQAGPSPVTFVAVSEHTARAWRHSTDAEVIRNGVDLDRWPPGPGGGSAIWFGRLVPEKGADLAIRAAQTAGLELDLVGPVADRGYFEDHIRPHLGPRIRYLGHLDHAALADRVGAAAVTLVTPRWDEPYGLVVAESLACGTPVAAFDRGGVAEVLDPECGVLVDADDVPGLADAAVRAASLSRAKRPRPRRQPLLSGHMIDAYESLYAQLTVAGRRRMIGYYVHHVGRGHLRNATCMAAALDREVTGLSSLPRPAGWQGPWIELERDDSGAPVRDPSAHGRLHWAPVHDAGLAARMARIAEWINAARPAALVVDVSVEVAVFGRLMGVPIVVRALPGDRSDPAHQLGYSLADAVLANWPAGLGDMARDLHPWADRTHHVGGLSRFAGRSTARRPTGRPPCPRAPGQGGTSVGPPMSLPLPLLRRTGTGNAWGPVRGPTIPGPSCARPTWWSPTPAWVPSPTSPRRAAPRWSFPRTARTTSNAPPPAPSPMPAWPSRRSSGRTITCGRTCSRARSPSADRAGSAGTRTAPPNAPPGSSKPWPPSRPHPVCVVRVAVITPVAGRHQHLRLQRRGLRRSTRAGRLPRRRLHG